MEMEELKRNWNLMGQRLERLEMENRRLQDKTVSSKLKQLRRRMVVMPMLMVLLLPNLFWIADRQMDGLITRVTCILLCVFLTVVVARQFMWWQLLNKIDCLKQSVREACIAEIRFRLFFKVGVAASVVCAVPLLASLLYNSSQIGNPYVMTGAWTGLAVGVAIGLFRFLRTLRDMKELREAMAELQC